MTDIKRSAIVPHTPAQMFDLVNDIAKYPEFIPWCKAAHIIERKEDEIHATLTFARGGMEKSFSTINHLQKDKMVELRLLNGPFKHLQGFWRFDVLPNAGCQVSLDMEFEFSNKLLGLAFGPMFTQIANMLVEAFCKRADVVYGK